MKKAIALVHIGIKGSVVALERSTGTIVWTQHLKGGDFVTICLDDDLLLAVTSGEVFALDAATGQPRWHNPLKGYGRGLASLVTPAACEAAAPPLMEEYRRRTAADAAAACGASGT